MTHRDALVSILKVCAESSEYSRRIQRIHETAMVALGLTENQRQQRHEKCYQRAEALKEQQRTLGKGEAKRNFLAACEKDSGEKVIRYRSHILKG